MLFVAVSTGNTFRGMERCIKYNLSRTLSLVSDIDPAFHGTRISGKRTKNYAREQQ
jgi:hypothetical protein